MLWLAIPVGLYFFRERIATTLAALPARKTVVQGHLITLVLGLLYILPVEFVGLGVLKRPAYLGSLWCNIFTLLYTLKSNYGAPPLPQISGFSMSNWRQTGQAALQQLAPWLQKAMSGVDFHWLFFVLIWIAAYPSVWAVVIIGRRSLWSVGSYCSNENLPETASWRESRPWKAFAPTWAKLKQREAEDAQFCSPRGWAPHRHASRNLAGHMAGRQYFDALETNLDLHPVLELFATAISGATIARSSPEGLAADWCKGAATTAGRSLPPEALGHGEGLVSAASLRAIGALLKSLGTKFQQISGLMGDEENTCMDL